MAEFEIGTPLSSSLPATSNTFFVQEKEKKYTNYFLLAGLVFGGIGFYAFKNRQMIAQQLSSQDQEKLQRLRNGFLRKRDGRIRRNFDGGNPYFDGNFGGNFGSLPYY